MLTLTRIDSTASVKEAPPVFNNNYSLIEAEVNGILGKLSVSGNTLRLTNLASVSAGGAEVADIVLTKASGNLLVVAPNGGATVMRVDELGNVYANKLVAAGDSQGSATTVKYMDVTESLRVTSVSAITDVSLDGRLMVNQANSSLLLKAQTFSITNDNCGASAATPLDLSRSIVAKLDYNNSGAALSSNAEVKVDLATVEVDQVIRFVLVRENSTGMRLHNGSSGSEVFATIDADGGGVASLAFGSRPTFDGAASPLAPSYLLAQCVLVGGSKRLLILESNGVTTS